MPTETDPSYPATNGRVIEHPTLTRILNQMSDLGGRVLDAYDEVQSGQGDPAADTDEYGEDDPVPGEAQEGVWYDHLRGRGGG